jgi:hypothetical protein
MSAPVADCVIEMLHCELTIEVPKAGVIGQVRAGRTNVVCARY